MDDKIIATRGKLSLYKVAPSSYVEPGRPRFPKKLSPTGRATFKKLYRLLASRRTATEGDGELLMLYATLSDRHTRALAHIEIEEEIVTTEKGMIPNPWLAVAERSEKTMLSILDKLGLTPASRDKVKTTRRREENDLLEILVRPEPQKEVVPCLSNGKTE